MRKGSALRVGQRTFGFYEGDGAVGSRSFALREEATVGGKAKIESSSVPPDDMEEWLIQKSYQGRGKFDPQGH
jgi:hypothetical protein